MKTVATDIEFSYENDVTEKDLRNIVKKVETFRKNCEYSCSFKILIAVGSASQVDPHELHD